MKFYFGESDSERIEGKTIEQAIKVYKISVLYPEKHVDKKYVKSSEYNHAANRYDYEFKPNPQIPIFDENQKKLGQVALYECVNVDFKSLLPVSSNLLEAPKRETSEDEEHGTDLIIIGNPEDLPKHDKVALRTMNDQLILKKREMEIMMRNIQASMDLIKKELKQKQKLFYILETYLGLKEEVIQIQEGDNAPEEEPLSLYQQLLFMDEETGIWENEGIDFNDIEKFDAFVLKNYEKFLYKEKSICAFKVRRNDKDYGAGFANAWANEPNKMTYFLIRNGTNFYRIWSNVTVGQKLFPGANEYEKMLDQERGNDEYRMQQVQDRHESYFYGVVAIQGLLERTDILGSSLRETVNIIRSKGLERVNFIRDGEQEFWLASGRLSWSEFIQKNRASIQQGSRILVTRRIYQGSKEENYERCYPFKPANGPSLEEIYEVDEFLTEGQGRRHGWNMKIMYNPGDTIFTRWDSDERKRRVPCWLYLDEVINFDAITIEECDYYQQNRLERKDYLSILPILHYMKKMKVEEQTMEKEFVRFIAGQLDWSEDRNSEIQEAINWWKLKNKWKRGLMKDDAKAVRMIARKLNSNQE